MLNGVLSRRERVAWLVAFVVVSAVIVATRFTSQDPDSSLYAALAARLSQEPAARWIAPEWWGLWTRTGVSGLYLDHPIGAFVLPAVLARLGMPGVQAAYVVGVGAGLLSILLIARFVAHAASAAEARAVLVGLQIMPAAFIFRVRANQEYLVLVCVLVTLAGIDRARRSLSGVALAALGFTAAFLIKGAFVLFSLIAAVVWIAANPTRARGSAWRAVMAAVVGLAAIVVAVLAYDAWYASVTGQRFWSQYWQDQMSPVSVSTPIDDTGTFLGHVFFYALRLLWHPAPWSVVLLLLAWTERARLVSVLRRWETAGRGLAFVVGFAALSVAALSPSSRVAERYVFSATYALGTAGVVAAWRTWPGLQRAFARLDARVPALPVTVWFVLVIARLTAGPWLPRILWRP